MSDPTAHTTVSSAVRERRNLSLIIGLFAVVLLLVLGGATVAGYQAGLGQHATQAYATQVAELQHQFALGENDLAAGRYAIAAERFAYILQIDPNYPNAALRLAEARQHLQATATPTLGPTAAPTPTPLPTVNSAAERFVLVKQAFDAADWDSVIANGLALKAMDVNYEAPQVNAWLFTALRSRGLARIQAKEMEAGIFDLNQAAEYGLLDADALNYRAWARLYSQAQSYWGLDWARVVTILEQLYLIAPYFHDTGTRLYQAHLNYAELLATQGRACDAAAQYAAAQVLLFDQTIANVQATQDTLCLTPLTPTLSPEGTLTETPTPTATP